MKAYLWIGSKIGQLIDLRISQKVSLSNYVLTKIDFFLKLIKYHNKIIRKDYMQLLLNVMSNNVSKSHDYKNLDELANKHLPKQMTRKVCVFE